MALQLVKPGDLPVATSVDTDAALVVQNGEAVEQATPAQIVDAGRPIASEVEAVTGTDNTKAMTPLTVRQAIDADTSGAVVQAQAAADAAEASALDAESAEEQTGLDAAATAADRIQTGLDVTATAADRVQTGLDAAATAADAVATAADRVQTGLDVVATGNDATATAADRVQTGLDATATAADRVQTGLDAAATDADRNYIDALVAAAPYPRHNIAIDPWGIVNQTGYVSGTATSGANQYTLDAVFIATSGQSLSWSGDGADRVLTFPAGGGGWVIDGADIRTGDHVINWNGNATCTVNGVARTKGEVFTLTAGTKVTVRFFGGTVAGWKLEEGTVSTPIEFLGEGAETRRVQMSYERITASSGGTSTAAAAQYADFIAFHVRKRATPAVNFSGGTVVNVTLSAADNPSRDGARILTTTTAAGGWNYLNRVLESDARLAP